MNMNSEHEQNRARSANAVSHAQHDFYLFWVFMPKFCALQIVGEGKKQQHQQQKPQKNNNKDIKMAECIAVLKVGEREKKANGF